MIFPSTTCKEILFPLVLTQAQFLPISSQLVLFLLGSSIPSNALVNDRWASDMEIDLCTHENLKIEENKRETRTQSTKKKEEEKKESNSVQ